MPVGRLSSASLGRLVAVRSRARIMPVWRPAEAILADRPARLAPRPTTSSRAACALSLPVAAVLAAVLALSFLSGGYIFSRTAPVVVVLLPLAAVWVWLAPRRLALDATALVALSAFALFALWEGLSIAWSVGPDLSWLAFDVTAALPDRRVRRDGHAGGPRAAAPGRLRLRLRHGPGGRLRVARKSVARRGDARPPLRSPERSRRLLERARRHADDGHRAGARGRLAPRPAGRGARRLRRRARPLPAHPLLHVLARRHRSRWCWRWSSTSRSPTSGCRARSALALDRGARGGRPVPRAPPRHPLQRHRQRRPAHRPGPRLRALGARSRRRRGRRRPGRRRAARPAPAARPPGCAWWWAPPCSLSPC